jgi:hypothetical protein
MNIINGKPAKAFGYQDHEAHIRVHMAAMQDPLIMQLVGQNPNANAIMAAAQAHIAEHVAFAYKQKMEQQMGVVLPDDEEDIPEVIEKQLSAAMPQAAAAVLGQSQQQAQQQQAEQQAQDPVLQMRMAELEIKKQQLALEQQKVQIDAAARADQTRLAETRIQIEAAEKADKMRIEEQRVQIDAARFADKQAYDERKLRGQEELNEQKLRVDAMRAGANSRAQDAAVRQRDQELAMQTVRDLKQDHDTNQLGESGQP